MTSSILTSRTKTYTATKEKSDKDRKWVLVDASGKTLGRLASQIASILRGKNKVTFSPHLNDGDFVIVVEAAKVKLTGNKLKDKMYRRHTGYIGGLKETSAGDMLKVHPTRVIEHAVKGMLPGGPLGRAMLKKLKIFAGSEHSHAAQNPEKIELKA